MRQLICCAVLLALRRRRRTRTPDDTPAAKKTRELLKTKITVEFKDTALRGRHGGDQGRGQGPEDHLDTKGGVSRNKTVTYKAKDKTVEEILDEMFKKVGASATSSSPRRATPTTASSKIRKSDERGNEKKK